MKLLNTIKGLWLLFFSTKIFHPENVFKGKRVAVIGAADSAFEKENGAYIDSFDLIVRVNKAPHSWSAEKAKFIGNRTDVLFHSFYENLESGGGPIDLELYAKQGINYIVNPNFNSKGLWTHLNYYKRNLNDNLTYILSRSFSEKNTKNFDKWIPTVGFSALNTILNSKCKEVYITGFTFFKTPYAADYRNQLTDMEANKEHIRDQGLHNPDLELKEFLRNLDEIKAKDTHVILDPMLLQIIKNQKN
ncbi:glycosyltransferase family 29 protein [Salegentibacter salegens]|uniref:Glycosyltransferase family 29 (Sialyltransferase) n=1 Tax=Salegentibacter salegens TaxID=143223 RepID=A0A1M7HDP8_9FLAO|nr:glycosyltransferase family 29 protein [Salegentibacter salegens]PRX43496.1 glycosyl transferase family 29 (putative sialyltransferase) [Salegentibacter salegens]SHM26473.1 Glycosyltransferase family 29 (sialyltransferase) [Salegentibacter salegens]